MLVKKRQGHYEQYDEKKVIRAIAMAFVETNEANASEVPHIAATVSRIIDGNDVGVEEVQDIVENQLLDYGYLKVAKQYIAYRLERNRLRVQRLTPDPDCLSTYIHATKYARYIPELKRRETYSETVNRVMTMHVNKFPERRGLIIDAFQYVYERQVMPSMRSLQFAGPAIEVHNARMYNCCFTHIDRISAFKDIFYLLLCGCGVGYSIQWQHIECLPKLVEPTDVQYYTVQDTIEGWALAMDALILGFVIGSMVEFNYSEIRLKGEDLEISGGKAPGHVPLRRCIEKCRRLLNQAIGRRLRPIECHDIICYIAEAVLSGGIRRSSLISLFSVNDTEMLFAKSAGNFGPGQGINEHRSMANNSAILLRDGCTKDEFDRIIRIAAEGVGEPGFLFVSDLNHGCNPCGEIGLNPTTASGSGVAFCNLCEVNVAACKNVDEFFEAVEAATIIGTLQATYTDFPFLGLTSERIADRDRLLGVGLLGMVDNPFVFDPAVQREAAAIVKTINIVWAEKLGINRGARLTTVKPGGTVSLAVGGVGAGIHPHHARRYFRRVTANPLEPVAQEFRRVNPHMVETKPNGDWVITFPVQAPEGAITLKDVTAIEFCEKVMSTYENWIVPGTTRGKLTHNVSCTVPLDTASEAGRIIDYIWNNRDRISAMAFAPRLIEKVFPFAPQETVSSESDERRWNYLIEGYTAIDWSTFSESEDNTVRDLACEGPTCEVEQ